MADYCEFFRLNASRLQQADLYRPWPNPTFDNGPFDAAPLRVLIVRLSPFRDVDRSISHLFLADAVRRAVPDAYVDMYFFSPYQDRRLLEENDMPLLTGIQSCRTMDEFDLVLVSNSYVLELINLPYLLIHSGIPVMSSERGGEWPPIVLGGSNAMAAQSIIRGNGDSIADAVFFGEGEGEVTKLVRALLKSHSKIHQDLSRRRRLTLAAGKIRGLWVAGEPGTVKVKPNIVAEPSAADAATDFPMLNSDVSETARLQVSFGCPAFCSFCFEGYDRKPYREIPAGELLQQAVALKRAQGCSTLDLYGFNVSSHSEFYQLLMGLNRLFEHVTLKSQRVDTLYEDPEVMQAEIITGKGSFTLGIEGISQRQRARLNKSLSVKAIDSVVNELIVQRVRELKLFFILTGDEEASDLHEFRAFCGRVKARMDAERAGTRIICSCGLLVRMPWTPMRYHRLMLNRAEWDPITREVESACNDNGLEFRLATTWSEYCLSQVMALGGYWLCDPVIEMAREGCCYDGHLDSRWWDWFRRWMENNGVWNNGFLGEKQSDCQFPLEFVTPRISGKFLYSQYNRGKEFKDSGYCLGGSGRRGTCLACGACVDAGQKTRILKHSPESAGQMEALRILAKRKQSLRKVPVMFHLGPGLSGVKSEWANAFVFKQLLSNAPELVDNVLSVEEQIFSVGDSKDRFGILGGETVMSIKAWDNNALLRLLPMLSREKSPDAFFVSVAERCTPGMFSRACIKLCLRVDSERDAAAGVSRYLKDAHLAATIRRVGEEYRLDVQTRKHGRGALFGGTYSIHERKFTARIEIGPKFDLQQFIAGLGGIVEKSEVEELRL